MDMELIPFPINGSVAIDNKEDLYQSNCVNYNTVTRKLADFKIPFIFYSLQKNVLKRDGNLIDNVFVLDAYDHEMEDHSADNNDESDNNARANYTIDLDNELFLSLFRGRSQDASPIKALSLFRPQFIDSMKHQEGIVILYPTHNNPHFICDKIQERKLFNSFIGSIYSYNVQKLQINEDFFQEIVNRIFITQNKIYTPRLQIKYTEKLNNRTSFQNSSLISKAKNNQPRINLNKNIFSREWIKNICGNLNLYPLKIKNHIRDNIISVNDRITLFENEQSYNLNQFVYKNNIVNLKSNKNEICLSEELKDNELGQEKEENDLELTVSAIFSETLKNSGFEVIDSWSETNLSKCEDTQSGRDISKTATTGNNLKSKDLNRNHSNLNIGAKRKASSYNFTKDSFDNNFCSVHNSKLQKYYHGDKASNFQYSNAIHNYGTLYSDNININNRSSAHNNMGRKNESNFNWCPPRRDFDLNCAYDKINDFVNYTAPNFGAGDFRRPYAPPYLKVHNEWNHEGNVEINPHANWTTRHTNPTKNPKQLNNGIKYASTKLITNHQRCQSPLNLINNRINYLQSQCNNLELRMSNLELQSQINRQFNDTHFLSFDDNFKDVGFIKHQINEILCDLVKYRGELSKVEGTREDVIAMYGDMLENGNTGAMLTEWQEVEIMDSWERLKNYEKFYGRKS